MKILFDFVTAYEKTGAGEYLRRVFYSLSERAKGQSAGIGISVLYDSSLGIAYEDLKPQAINQRYVVPYYDCKDRLITDIVEKEHIDKFFIACAQTYRDHREIADLKCDVICVSHDLWCEENIKDKLFIYWNLINPGNEEPAAFSKLGPLKKLPGIKHLISKIDKFALQYITSGGSRMYDYMLQYEVPAINLYHNNPNTKIITVSEYSKSSMMYHYDIPSSDITVLYSPERVMNGGGIIENKQLAEIIESNRKFFLMVSANRMSKNPHKVINAFKAYSKIHPDEYLVTLGYEGKKFENHMALPFLGESDLAVAYSHCHAFIFASFFEGFGYPPLEAMKYGKPILCSNVTSMPEILGEAPIYFSPFYESAIFQALMKLDTESYRAHSRLSEARYELVRNRQEEDLNTLINLLLK